MITVSIPLAASAEDVLKNAYEATFLLYPKAKKEIGNFINHTTHTAHIQFSIERWTMSIFINVQNCENNSSTLTLWAGYNAATMSDGGPTLTIVAAIIQKTAELLGLE